MQHAVYVLHGLLVTNTSERKMQTEKKFHVINYKNVSGNVILLGDVLPFHRLSTRHGEFLVGR